MKKVLLASVATGALALAGSVTGALTTADSANAADLRMPLKAPPPPAPVFSWSGCYVGAEWGWGWGKKKGAGFDTYSDTFSSYGSFDNTISGALFGGQIGCNYQWPGSNFVIGVEGSYAAADINGYFANVPSRSSSAVGTRAKVDSIASITGRIGWNGWDPNVLFYFKGGGAWAHERDSIGYSAPFTNTRSGWTIGGGIEWAFAFAPRWSAFVEYDYYSFSNKDLVFTETFLSRSKLDINTVKVGVNYKLYSPF